MKGKVLLKGLLLVVCLLLLSVTNVMAQIDYCEGNFDGDDNVDGTDLAIFKSDYGRNQYNDPCPPGTVGGCGGLLSTGQTQCWDGSGNPVSCAGTGQDGEYQLGFSRFTDHGDGTVTDNATGLMWTKGANLFGAMIWEDALQVVELLLNQPPSCGGLPQYCDWRLPNIRELKSLYDSISYDDGMPMEPHPFVNVQSNYYWSSTTNANLSYVAWSVDMDSGYMGSTVVKDFSFLCVWAVRGGQ